MANGGSLTDLLERPDRPWTGWVVTSGERSDAGMHYRLGSRDGRIR